eukprot:scaffold159973_cov13-Tisochrysis_lutea.AAC.1
MQPPLHINFNFARFSWALGFCSVSTSYAIAERIAYKAGWPQDEQFAVAASYAIISWEGISNNRV